MKLSFLDHIPSTVIILAIFGLMLLFNFIGIWLAVFRVKNNLKNSAEEIGAMESGLLGLLALLRVFTFGAANTHLHKNLIYFKKNRENLEKIF